jgi:small subunit ribosomal protein S4
MSKRESSKHKLDRRMGENIWGRPKSPVNRREYGPGQHGQRRKGKMSDFGVQLRAKQKLKGYYGDISEKQFKKIYTEAGRRTNIGSYSCKVGDVIEVKDASKQLAIVLEAVQLAERDVPDYVQADHNKMVATFARVPVLTDVPYAVQMEPNLVVEFYSR